MHDWQWQYRVKVKPPASRVFHRRFTHSEHTSTLHVEYTERGTEYGILFIFSLFCEFSHLQYVRIHVMYSVDQAEYDIHILVVAPQEYVNIYSTRRTSTPRTGS